MSTIMERIVVRLDLITAGFEKKLNNINKSSSILDRNVKRLNKSLSRFRMDLLGVGFAGVALTAVMTNLLRPVADVYGVFELWSATLTLVFLPTMDMIFPLLLGFMETLMNLPEPVKQLIGIFAIFGLVLGKLLSIFGFGLIAISALKSAGLTLGVAFTTIGAILAVLIGAFVIISGFLDVTKGKWEGLGKIIAGIGIVLIAFIGVWAAIPIAIGTAVYLIIKHWDKIKEFFSNLWNGIKDRFNAALDWIKTWAKKFVDFLWNALPSWVQQLINGTLKLVASITTKEDKKSSTTKSTNKKGDFIWRAGHGVTNISPEDTIVGAKDPSKLSGGAQGITLNNTYNISVSDRAEMQRLIDNNNRSLVRDLQRIVKT